MVLVFVTGHGLDAAEAPAVVRVDAGCAGTPLFEALRPHLRAAGLRIPAHTPEAASDVRGLSPREAQVVEQLRLGLTNKEIARCLGIAEDTVKKHLHSAFGKLGVRRRALLMRSTSQHAPLVS